MRTFLSILLCLILSSLNSSSGNEIFKHLTINDGLAHTDANCVAQDSTGLMWIGTFAGLQSYDGYSLQTFNYYQEGHKIFKSHNRIQAMVCTKDKLWVGTESGLTCFDLNTHRYVPFYVREGEQKYDSDLAVYKLYVDPAGCHLWTGSSQGMIVMRIDNDTIRPLKWNSEEERLFGKNIGDIQFQGEIIWANTGRHIAQLGIRDGKVSVLKRYPTKNLLQKDETVQSIYCIDDFLYMRTGSGCYRVSLAGGELHEPTLVYADFHHINSKIPTYTNGKFIVGKDGSLWCGYLEGIFEVRYPFSETPSIQEYLKNARDDKQSMQKIRDLLIDKYNNLWIATSSWGIYYRTLSNPLFKNLSNVDFREMGLSQNEIISVTGQEDGTIWMVVEYANLFRYVPQTGQLDLVPLPKDRLHDIYLQNLEMSHDQRHLYIGSSHGVFIYDILTGKLERMSVTNDPNAYRIHMSIADLREDESGRLWIGTWGDGLLCIDNPLTSPAVALYLNTQTDPCILSNQISDMLIRDRSVFLCTTNGLNRLTLTEDGKIKTLAAYQTNETSPETSMSTNYLAGIDCYNDSVCWIGTIGGGLNKLVLHSERKNDYTATCYTMQDGLANNDCEIVLVDNSGNVWIGGNGMVQLDIQKNKMYTYGFANGLQNNAFKVNVSYKAKDGTFYMGGLYGISSFRPDQFTHDAGLYSLMFTNLSVNNQRIIPNTIYDGRVVLNRILNETSKLTLNYKQNNFTVSFAALGYELSDQIMYRYRLKGFQNDWRILRYINNEVYFSNLPYDSYQLEVELSTDKGYTWQTPGKELEIIVLPPWWLSAWAKMVYIIIVVLIVVIAFRQYNKEQNLKKENEIQKILIAQDEEKYQAKMQFFMNASHELKTPLTLILLAAEKLTDANQPGKECRTILYNVKRMLALISELVDIRKQDLGLSTLHLDWINMSQMIRQLFDDMSSWAENKHITITYNADDNDIEMDADKEKIGKMILNLFSNAIKYTDEGGRIDISFKQGTQKDVSPCYDTVHTEGAVPADVPLCILTVKDTGIGISSESIHLIYERFFQVNGNSQSHLGSGIGLAVVKSVVLQHKGMIVVSSERMRGSEFIIALPVYENCRSNEPAVGNHLLDVRSFIDEQYNEFEPVKASSVGGDEPVIDNPDLPTLLIVEDNQELQSALKERLSAFYNIHIADNGRMGLEKCMSVFPDIIVSDVMMPEMDGIEMCRRIKNNLSVASIPLVLLTAKDTVESQIEGYESGADLYIAKPFSMKLLEVNIHRLLVQREQWMRGKADRGISESGVEEVEVSEVKSGDMENGEEKTLYDTEEQRVLTERLKNVIDENISDPNLSPEQLSSALGVSRSKLYREIKRIDGYSLSDYVRNVRLEKAAYLLVNSHLNIQEIMNEVGFINSSHFTKVFKLKYDMTPSEYKRNT